MGSRYSEREEAVRGRFQRLKPTLDERGRRLFGAAEVLEFGHGGYAAVQRATGLAESTLRRGVRELEDLERLAPPEGKQRRPGGGRRRAEKKDPGLVAALEALVEPVTRGDPESPLRWTAKGVRRLAAELAERGHAVSRGVVARLLKEQGYTLQGTRKVLEGSQHPDRNAQFEFINKEVKRFQAERQPVISIDTKKKELVGTYANRGQEWHAKREGPKANTYDFPNGKPKAVPYGVYDLARNEGWVSVSVSSDTAEFATNTILRWWTTMGRDAYPEATDLLVTADCGGSNSYRGRLWRLMVQRVANETGLAVSVAHLPPGTSKWNKIEYRMFSHITMNWRGRPLISYEAIVQLIGNTRTTKGLTIRCELDEATYKKGQKVDDSQLNAINIERHSFHGEWNYTIYPQLNTP
ncbi:MAG: ISAzo13 family transposase [Proteobacteria bacterium]|nr:ISAzo13 family transposase [Pseudomonadota bacterium]MCP4920026.1 ISAzo13 family transposase [Pseudomonadota bacterium]